MTRDKSNHPKEFEAALSAMRADEPSSEQIRVAGERVFQKLQERETMTQPEVIRSCEDVVRALPAFASGQLPADRRLLIESHVRDCASCRKAAQGRTDVVEWKPVPAGGGRRFPSWALAVAAVVLAVCGFAVHNLYFAVPAGARATVQSIDGVAYRVTPDGDRAVTAGAELGDGDVLRTAAGAHAYVKLSDGSVVELNERSDFAVKARGKNMTIVLDRGAVIVQAAKRTSGHLYVKTPDCRVSVTGTVFAVNSGVKGSRVSVVEGAVDVAYGGNEDILHSGDQVSTGANMTSVPVQDDIAWSRDLPKHLELLAQFAKLQHRLEQVQMPAPRYNSRLLARMPADTIVYASMPNAGQALEDANRILQEQIQQSAALREWWSHGDPQSAAKLNETVAKIRLLSDYLDDEVVVAGFGGKKSGLAVVAGVRRSGLQEFLNSQFATLAGEAHVRTVTEAELPRIGVAGHELLALTRPNEVVFAGDGDTLRRVNAQLNAGGGGLDATEFGQHIAEAYGRGAGVLLAADLQTAMANTEARSRRTPKHNSGMRNSGLEDMRYLIAEHRELNGIPDNRMVLEFAGERRRIASWLAAPAPMGSLEFVSRNASVAIALVTKEPVQMFNDMMDMSGGRNSAKQQAEIAEAEAKLNVRLREDIAAHFGGDAVIALDGPVLPTPSWKLIVEVHDAPALAVSLEKVVQAASAEAQRKGHAGIALQAEDVSGQRYYSVSSSEAGRDAMHFTFAGGYMIIGPSRAVLMNTLHTRSTGDSLARSAEFKALLPKDANANYSLIAYQNLSPILQPLLSQLSGEQAKMVQELAADSRPSVVCAWGRENRIEAVTNSRLLGFDWLTVGSLLSSKGTNHRSTP